MSSVDIAIPNYNYGRFLSGCVQSVLSQDIPDLRVLIIDNASSDDSPAIARELAAADSRIELRLRPRNLGPHASFNEAVDWAASDYFLILCADDLLAPGALRHATALMDRQPNVHLTCGQTHFLHSPSPPTPHEGGNAGWRIQSGHQFLKALCRCGRNAVSGPTALVRTSVQKRAGHYRPELVHTDDLELWMRFCCLGDVATTGRVQAIARVHSANQSAQVRNMAEWNAEFEAAFECFFRNEGAALPDAGRLLSRVRLSLAERAYSSALSATLANRPDARQLFEFSFRLCPRFAILPPLAYLARKSFAASVSKLGERDWMTRSSSTSS